MVDGVDQIVEAEAADEAGVKETLLGGREFRGAPPVKDPMAADLKPAPEGVPEQFWDDVKGELRTDALLKSYSDLRKKMDGGSEEEAEEAVEDAQETVEGSEEENPEGAEEGAEEASEGDQEGNEEQAGEAQLASAIVDAQAVFAEKQELDAEARAPLKALGITDDQIDFYIAGVKATEAALHSAAEKAAGSPEDLAAAMDWAAKGGMTQKQIVAFNAQMGDVELVGPAVTGLMDAFRKANPGEGRLHNVNTGLTHGDVYTHMDEFDQDLAKADQLRDPVRRRKAIDKLRRSRQAGTVKSERRQPFGG